MELVDICHKTVVIWIRESSAIKVFTDILVDLSNDVVKTMGYSIGLDIASDTQEAQRVCVGVN